MTTVAGSPVVKQSGAGRAPAVSHTRAPIHITTSITDPRAMATRADAVAAKTQAG